MGDAAQRDSAGCGQLGLSFYLRLYYHLYPNS